MEENNIHTIKATLEKLLSSHTIGTRFIAGRYICIECGARSDTRVTFYDESGLPVVSSTPEISGAFDNVAHTSDCLLEKLITSIRKLARESE